MNLNGLFSDPLAVPHLTVTVILINLVLAFVLSFVSAVIYRATHKGLSYSQSFTISLILISFFIAAIVMVIGNSLALAFAAFGAVSLIRFRTAIKDARDIAFVLLAVAIGFASGTGSYIIAVATTGLGLLIVYGLAQCDLGAQGVGAGGILCTSVTTGGGDLCNTANVSAAYAIAGVAGATGDQIECILK